MSNPVRKATFRTLINEVLVDIMVASSSDNIIIDKEGTLLSDYLTNVVLNEDLDRALANLKSEILDGSPEIFDTLKEISDWITSHGDFTEYLEDLVNNKADRTELQEVSSALVRLSQEFTNRPTVYYSDTQPSNLKPGDMWVQPVVDASVLDGLQPT